MFPYSFGVQAPTKAQAKIDLAAQADALAQKHPEQAETYAGHLKTVQAAAGVLIDSLPEDDSTTDVAVSAAGHLKATPNADDAKIQDVQSASLHVAAERRPTDPSKHAKPVKAAKAAPAP